MTAIIVTNPDTDNAFTFASNEALEAAMDWYNATSKADLIAYYEANGGSISAFYVDDSRETLSADWADCVMELYAAKAFGGARE